MWLKKVLFEYKKKRFYKKMCRINPNPRVYDMSNHKGWGDSICISRVDGSNFRIHGWLAVRPNDGDKLIYDVQGNKKAMGYIVNVEYCRDPADMFFADVVPYELI